MCEHRCAIGVSFYGRNEIMGVHFETRRNLESSNV